MDDFPSFMKSPGNRIATSGQSTRALKVMCSTERMEAKWHSGHAARMRFHPLTCMNSTST